MEQAIESLGRPHCRDSRRIGEGVAVVLIPHPVWRAAGPFGRPFRAGSRDTSEGVPVVPKKNRPALFWHGGASLDNHDLEGLHPSDGATLVMGHICSYSVTPNVAFSRGADWRGLCSAQTVTGRTVGYNAWLGVI